MTLFLLSLIVSSIFTGWFTLFTVRPKLPVAKGGFLEFLLYDSTKDWYMKVGTSIFFDISFNIAFSCPVYYIERYF